jgi:hypothetical protein
MPPAQAIAAARLEAEAQGSVPRAAMPPLQAGRLLRDGRCG